MHRVTENARRAGIRLLLLGGVVMLIAGEGTAEVPAATPYQGVLLDDTGAPRNVSADMRVRIWTDPFSVEPDALLFQEAHPNVDVVGGLFSLSIGTGAASVGVYGAQLFDGPERWLELEVDGETLEPRQRFYATPYALRSAESDNADALQGMTADQLVASARTGLHFSDLQGVVSALQVSPSITLDHEVVELVVDAGGSGSNFDADRLDGLDAGSFLRLGESADFAGAELRMLQGSTLDVEGRLRVGSEGIDFRDGEERIGFDPALESFTFSSVVAAEAFRMQIPDLRYDYVNGALFTAGSDHSWERIGRSATPESDGNEVETFARVHFYVGLASISEFMCGYADEDPSEGANLVFRATLWESPYTGTGLVKIAEMLVETTDETPVGSYWRTVNIVPRYLIRPGLGYYWIDLVMLTHDPVGSHLGRGPRRFHGCRVGYLVHEP